MDPIRATDKMLKYMFTLLGLVALGIGLVLTKHTLVFIEDSVLTEGHVIELDKIRSEGEYTFKPIVSYRDNNGYEYQFRSSAGSNPPRYAVGDQVEVLYKASLPEQAKIKDFFSLWGLEALFSFGGAVFFSIGLTMILRGYFKRVTIKNLKIKGRAINAKIEYVQVNDMVSINYENPYVVIASWKDPLTSINHEFKSENLWFDPTGYITNDEIIVYIDKKDSSKYFVDTSFLPFPEKQEPF